MQGLRSVGGGELGGGARFSIGRVAELGAHRPRVERWLVFGAPVIEHCPGLPCPDPGPASLYVRGRWRQDLSAQVPLLARRLDTPGFGQGQPSSVPKSRSPVAGSFTVTVTRVLLISATGGG